MLHLNYGPINESSGVFFDTLNTPQDGRLQPEWPLRGQSNGSPSLNVNFSRRKTLRRKRRIHWDSCPSLGHSIWPLSRGRRMLSFSRLAASPAGAPPHSALKGGCCVRPAPKARVTRRRKHVYVAPCAHAAPTRAH